MGGVIPSSEKLHIFALKCKKQITVEPNKMYITSARLHCFYEIIDTLDCSPAMSVCDIAHLMCVNAHIGIDVGNDNILWFSELCFWHTFCTDFIHKAI